MPNQDLINYIKQARVEGTPDQQIKEGLLKAGWAQTDIDDSFRTVAGLSIELEKKSYKKLIFTNKRFAPIIVIIVAIIIILGGIGGYLYIKNKNQPAVSTKTNVSTSTQTNVSLDISTWKNFDNGFVSFKYPSDWKLDASKYSPSFTSITSQDGQIGLSVSIKNISGSNLYSAFSPYPIKTRDDIYEFYKTSLPGTVSNERDVKIDNLSGKAFDVDLGNLGTSGNVKMTEIIILTKNYDYNFALSPNISNEYLSDVVSTIKINTETPLLGSNMLYNATTTEKIKPSVSYIDCGKDNKDCLLKAAQSCSSAIGSILNGTEVQYTINGEKDGKCTFQAKILSVPSGLGAEQMKGLEMTCALPNDQVIKIISVGSSIDTKNCSGSWVDFILGKINL